MAADVGGADVALDVETGSALGDNALAAAGAGGAGALAGFYVGAVDVGGNAGVAGTGRGDACLPKLPYLGGVSTNSAR